MKEEKRKAPKLRFPGFEGDWEQRKVSEVCSISTGKSNTQDKIDGGAYPFYVRSPIVERSNRYLYDEEAVLTVGDGVGTGKVFHYVNGKYDLHQRVYRLFNFSDNTDAKFFYQWFSNKFYNRVMSMTAKTSVDSVRLEMIADMAIIAPSYDEQQKISGFLNQIDTLITLHQQKLDQIKEYKKGMLQKMFPKKGETVPEVRFPGFEGDWEQRNLGDDIESIQTGTNLLGSTTNHGTPLLKMGNIQRGYFDVSKLEYLNQTEVVEPENIVYYGDFFFNTRNTLELVGKGATWTGESGKYAFNSNIARFTFKDIDTIFFNYLYNTESVTRQIHARATGTTSVAAIYPRALETVSYYIPSKEEQLKIGRLFYIIDNTITLHQHKLDGMKEYKKGLLQQMFA